MSHFSILRVDHHNPVAVGRRNRRLYTIYGILPMLVMLVINIITIKTDYHDLVYLVSGASAMLIAVLITVKTRKNNKGLKPIGDLEITRSMIRKKIGDIINEYDYRLIKEISLAKHMPSTKAMESKGRYFSYILSLITVDGEKDTFIVADRSVDHDRKISVVDTLKTLKKIAGFSVRIDT